LSLQIAARPATSLVQVDVRDFLREADFQRLSSPLSAIRKHGHLETDADGLLDLPSTGLNISVSPDCAPTMAKLALLAALRTDMFQPTIRSDIWNCLTDEETLSTKSSAGILGLCQKRL
jgi:hypothetical protein